MNKEKDHKKTILATLLFASIFASGIATGGMQNAYAGVTDTTPPMITCPSDVGIEVGDSTDPSNTGEATATDDMDSDPDVSPSDENFLNPDGTGTIERTWTAEDFAGNTASCLQIITITDTTPPMITCPSDVMIIEGDSTNPSNTGEATATDNSDLDPYISHNDVGSNGQITRTWTAEDFAGNTAFCDQIITITPSEEVIEGLIEDVNNLNDEDLNHGNINSLVKKLENAIKNLTNDDLSDDFEACEKLQSFIDQLNAFVNSGKLTEGQVQDMQEIAHHLHWNLCIDT